MQHSSPALHGGSAHRLSLAPSDLSSPLSERESRLLARLVSKTKEAVAVVKLF